MKRVMMRTLHLLCWDHHYYDSTPNQLSREEDMKEVEEAMEIFSYPPERLSQSLKSSCKTMTGVTQNQESFLRIEKKR